MDLERISKLEKLARLALTDDERRRLAADLERILAMVDALQRLDTSGVEPLVYLNDTADLLRDDAVDPASMPGADAILQQAPDRSGPFFRVPIVIEQP